jgi:hypothetical protein
MVIRGIPERLPETVFREADNRFHDEITGHFIAIKEALYGGKRRLIMVAYDTKNDVVEIITVHPIGRGQVEARVKSKRWSHVS